MQIAVDLLKNVVDTLAKNVDHKQPITISCTNGCLTCVAVTNDNMTHVYEEPAVAIGTLPSVSVNIGMLAKALKVCSGFCKVGVCSEKKVAFVMSDRTVKLVQTDNPPIEAPSQPKAKQKAQLPSKTLLNDLEYLYPAISNDEKRANINDVLFDSDNIVATNGYVMHLAPNSTNFVGQLSLTTVTALINLLKRHKKATRVDIASTDSIDYITIGPWCIVVPKNSNTFPPYKSLLETVISSTHAVVNVSDLKSTLKKLLSFGSNYVKLILNNQKLTLVVADNDIEITSEIIAKIQGEPIEVALNPTYLVKALANSQLAKISCNKGLTPIRLTFRDTLHQAIIMPIRL